MRLHEYYFDNLGGKAPIDTRRQSRKKMPVLLAAMKHGKKISGQRGNAGHWLGRPVSGHHPGKLLNFWINEHDGAHPVGCNPIFILDVFEHAFMIDYGLKRADYIKAFFKNIDWKAAEVRLA